MEKSKLQTARDAIAAAIALGMITEDEAQKIIAEADAAAMRALSVDDTTRVLRATERLQDTMKKQKVGPVLARTIVAAVGRLADERTRDDGKR